MLWRPIRLGTLALSISDVPGDDVTAIASGPTVADPTSLANARTLLADYGINLPAAVVDLLNSLACETPFADDPALSRSEMHLVATICGNRLTLPLLLQNSKVMSLSC